MTSPFTMAGWCSPIAEPYAQGVVLVQPAQGFALAAAGAGGGAAQLLPATLLQAIVADAESAITVGHPPRAALGALFDRIAAEVDALAEGPIYLGSGAAAAAALVEAAAVHVAAVGLCRASSVTPGQMRALTTDESLHEVAARRGEPTHDSLRTIAVRRFGADPLQTHWPWQVISVPHDPAAAYLLSTAEIHTLLPSGLLHTWTLAALGTKDLQGASRRLWQQGHDWLADRQGPTHRDLHQYRRTAALVLIRPG